MPSIPLAGSPSAMTAPSGEGQTGQSGAGDAFAALFALLAAGGPLPPGVLPVPGGSGGSDGAAQTTPAAPVGGPLTAQALLAVQMQTRLQAQQAGTDLAVPAPPNLQGQAVPAQAPSFALPLPQTAAFPAGTAGETATALTAPLAPAGAPTGAETLASAVQTALSAATTDATAGTAAEPGAAVDAPAGTPAPQDIPDQAVAAAAAGSGAGASTGEDASRRSGTGAAEATGAAGQAVPQATATTQVTGPERVSAPAPQQPAPPASQIAVHVLPLRQDPDGIHRLTVHLHPADLGPVSVVAELRNGAVHLQLAGTSDGAFDALRSALPSLRQELEEGGFSACTLDLQREAPGDGRRPGEQTQQFSEQGHRGQAASGPAATGRAGDAYQNAPAPAAGLPADGPGSRMLNVRL
ncbi:flagellar hook-length control protein FliK [Planomonospora sp. ID82291]|uniref:flagellar hook-length control protein FliK n=1 Tax=Planomonospora sp. ID82291 TaxID=2738136 RepID=UPI0027DCEDDA|nr:flagellar hook-length control protein FliK [Planomonospora sp. ID82291]